MSTIPKGVALRAEVHPTETSAKTAPVYANSIRVSNDGHGFTVSFFAVPPDPTDLPEVVEQLDALREAPGEAREVAVKVHLDHAAKVFLPPDIIPGIIEVLGLQYSKHLKVKQELEKLNNERH